MGDIFKTAAIEASVIDETQSEQIAKSKLDRISKTKSGSYKLPDNGWINLPTIDLPTKGRYYPNGTSIHIRAAETKQIRHYSTMDERDYLNVDDKLNYILEQCSKVYMSNKKATYKDIKEIDRIYIILAIKELTFINSQNNINLNVECDNCGTKDNIEITKNSIPFLEFDEKLEKYFDEELKCFNIKTKSGETFKLHLPSLGMTNFTKNYARMKSYNNKYFDESFLRMLMYLDYDYDKLNDKTLKDIDIEITNWSSTKISIVTRLIDIIDDAMTLKIAHTCTGCGREVHTDIQFQNGYKSLFILSDVFDELA